MSGENMEVPSMFPDVTNFPPEPDVYEATPCVWRGQACESYTLKAPTYDETTGSNQKPGSKLEGQKTQSFVLCLRIRVRFKIETSPPELLNSRF